MKKFVCVLAALVVAASAFAGGGKDKGASSSTGRKFGFSPMDGTNPFYVTIRERMKELVEARGDTLIATDPANDVTKQVSQVEDMLTLNLDGLFLAPVDKAGIRPALDAAKSAGLPIIGFDSEVDDMSYLVSYAGSDNYNAGKVCGDDLKAKRPDGGDIIVLDSPTQQSVVDRTNGFLDAIKGAGFNIVGQQDAKGTIQLAMQIAEDLLQAHPGVVAIFGGNDPAALGAMAAANAAGIKKGDCLIYGVDGSPDIKAELMRPGSLIEGTGAQSPIAIAETAVEAMYKYLEGNAVDARYPVATFLITSDNVAQYGADGWQ